MKEFKISKEGFERLKKKTLIQLGASALITLVVFPFIYNYINKNDESDTNIFYYVIPIMLLMIGYSSYKSIRKMKSYFDTYLLNISDEIITRKQSGLEIVSISRIEIQEIIKHSNDCFSVRGVNPADIIYIPIEVENHAEIEKILNAMHPVSIKQKNTLQKFRPAIIIVFFAAVIGGLIATNKILLGICGTVVIGMFSFTTLSIYKNKNVMPQIKKKLWLTALVFIILIVNIIIRFFSE